MYYDWILVFMKLFILFICFFLGYIIVVCDDDGRWKLILVIRLEYYLWWLNELIVMFMFFFGYVEYFNV